MKNIKLTTALTISIFSLNVYATDYDDATFDNFVDGQGVNEVLDDAQFILCSLARFGTESLAGDGTYKATIYSDECEGQGAASSDSSKGTTAPTSAKSSSSSSSSSSAGTAGTSTNKEVDTVIINTGFITQTLQKTKAWIIDDQPFSQDDYMPKSITYLLNEQTAPSSEANKFGTFTLRYQVGTYGNKRADFKNDSGQGPAYFYDCPAETSQEYKYSWCSDGVDLGRGILAANGNLIQFKAEGQQGQNNVVAEYSSNGDIAGIYTKNEGFQDDSLRNPDCDGIEGDWWECQSEAYRQSSTQVLGIFAFGISQDDKSYCTKMSELYKVDWSKYNEATDGPTLTAYTLSGGAGERLQQQGWDVSEKCFSIDKSDAIADIWDYGVYNSDGSKYYATNQAFPIKAPVTINGVKRNAHGYASYWGVHVDENYQSLVDDSTEWVREDDNSETPTKYNVTARKLVVEKREKKFEALNDLDSLSLNFWTNDSHWSDEFYKLGFAKIEPYEGKFQFKSNKATLTDYNNGSSSDPLNYGLYGSHDGKATFVVDLVGTTLDKDNLNKIIENDSNDPGKPMNLTMEFAEFPNWDSTFGAGYTQNEYMRFYLCNKSGVGATNRSVYEYSHLTFPGGTSGLMCLRLEGALELSTDGNEVTMKSIPKDGAGEGNYYANFRDFDSGTELQFSQDNWNNSGYEYDIKITKAGINRPAALEVKVGKMLNAFGNLSQFDNDGGTIQSGLKAFLDSSNNFSFLLSSFDFYDGLGNRFNKVSGSFGVSSDPAAAVFVDDINVVEGSTTSASANDDKDVSFAVSLSKAQASDVTFDYAISSASTASSDDYSGLTNGTATIAAGSTSTTIPVTIIGDVASEGNVDETIILTLSNASNATLGRTSATAYIYDNDQNRVVYEDYIGSYSAATNTFTVTDGLSFASGYSKTKLPAPISFTTAEYLAAMVKVYGEGEEWEFTEYRDLNVYSQDTNQSYSIGRNSFANPTSNTSANGISTEKSSIVPISELPAKLNCIQECLKSSLVQAHYADVKSQADPGGDNSYSGNVGSVSPYPYADVGPYVKTSGKRTVTYEAGTENEYSEEITWTRGEYRDGILADDVYVYTADSGVFKDASDDEVKIGIDWGVAYPSDKINGAGFNQLDPYNAWKRETQWGINTGTLVDDTTLAKLECDHTIKDSVKTYNESHPEYTSANGKISKTRYCTNKLWNSKEVSTSYSVRLETYKQYEIKNTNGSNLTFAEPKTLYFTAPDTDKFGDDRGKKFRLELNGDYLGGIPGSVIDISTGEDKGEYVTSWNENYRWVQRFIIPDGSELTQNTSTDTYLVKALAGQEWLGKKDSAIGSLATLLNSKTKSDLLTNKDLNWEVMTREVNVYDCSLKTTKTDSDGNSYEETDWEACYALSPDDSTYNDVWTLTASYADCNVYLDAQYREAQDRIDASKAEAVAGGYEYGGPNSVTELVTGSEYGDFYSYWLKEKDRCKTIGVLPTSIINGGNASVVNGTVVYDPTP